MNLSYLKKSGHTSYVFPHLQENKKRALAGFISEGKTLSIQAQANKITFRQTSQKTTEGKVITTTATIKEQVCGYAFIEIIPFKNKKAPKIATMDKIPMGISKPDNLTEELADSRSNSALRVDEKCRGLGIGRKLLFLSMHHAATLGLPLFQVPDDITPLFHPKKESFYQKLGFVSGLRTNQALRQIYGRDILPHNRKSQVFYLNGILEGARVKETTISFNLPDETYSWLES